MWLELTVSDTGIGIPSGRMDRLFRSFSQIDSSTTRKYGGTGLGLAISKRLTGLLGGAVWAESEGIPGHGTRFHFTIQIEPTWLPHGRTTEEYRALFRGKRLLIVDDNATNRRILALHAHRWGFSTHAAATPTAALELVASGEGFDLAVLDMNMPDMDGVMLAEAIRRWEADHGLSRPLPLLLFSSIASHEAGRQDLFAACINKPLKPRHLRRLLFDILAEERRVRDVEATPASEFDGSMAERFPLRILVAEDNQINLRLALRFLERMGYRADVAQNGLEVIEALKRQPYDVILMDVAMPEMDGLEATRAIRRRVEPERQPRIIAMTANAMREDRDICLAAGMDDYLPKPVDIAALQRALERSGLVKGRPPRGTSGADQPLN